MSVTIKDVAKKAGVCPATVSKVINNSSTISAETTRNVLRVMKELDYTPNIVARNLSSKKTKNIVYFSLYKQHDVFINPHMFEIMAGIKRRIDDDGYTLIYESTDDIELVLTKVKKIVSSKMADGIIIHGSATTKDVAEYLYSSDFPYIFIGKPLFHSNACWIDTNQILAGEIAAKHLWERNHHSIAFIGGRENEPISTQRYRGACFALKNFNSTLESNFVKYTNGTPESIFSAAASLLNNINRPNAIICENNNILFIVMQLLHDRGIKVPNEIAVIGFDNYPLSQLISPSPTIVDINVYEIGLEAADSVIRKINHPVLSIQSYTTVPQLIIRKTT